MKKFLSTIVILTSLAPACFAIDVPQKISIQEAINLAVENNIDYKAAKLDVDIAKNKIKEANQLKNPDFNVFYNLGKSGQGNPQQLGLTETIEIAKRSARKEFAKSYLKLTKENVEYFEFDLKMDVREAYIDLVAAKSILDCLEHQQKSLQELVDIAENRVKLGTAPKIDVLQAKIALNEMVTQVNTTKVNEKTALIEFNKVINPNNKTDMQFDTKYSSLTDKENFMTLLTPKPESELPPFESIEKNSLKNRFDLKVAKQRIHFTEKNLTVVVRQRIPDLTIFGGYGYQNKNVSSDGTFQNGAYVGGSLVNIPLLYTYKPEIQNAQLEVEKAKLYYTSTENKAKKNINSAYEKFLTAKLNLNYYNDKLLKDSNEMMELSKTSYESGSDITGLIVMQQAYEAILIGYTNTLANYYNCWIDFLREVNVEEFNLENETI